MRIRIILATALSGIAVATAALVPSAANAATSDCPAEYFCAWRDLNFDGTRNQWIGNSNAWSQLNNNSSSWYNNGVYIPGGPDDVMVYDTSLFRDSLFCLWRGQSLSYSAAFNDRPSSHKWVVSC
jgi:hypothetical protein